jgi:hypothetical protein
MTTFAHKMIFLAASAALLRTHETLAFLSPPAPQEPRRKNLGIITEISSSPTTPSLLTLFSMDFKQQPGERDIDFIKRITSTSNAMLNEPKLKSATASSSSSNPSMSTASNVTETTKSKGVYKKIEEWDEERKASGELTWEEKVQFEGQRFGNQVKQDHILRHHIGTFF